MLKYLKEFRKHKNIIVQTNKCDYKVYKIENNKFSDGKDELHIALTGSKLNDEREETYAVVGLYDLHLRINKFCNRLDPFLGRGKIITLYVIFTSTGESLSILLKPLPKEVVEVGDILKEIKTRFGGEVKLNGKYINPSIDSKVTNKSNLSPEELENNIKITGY